MLNENLLKDSGKINPEKFDFVEYQKAADTYALGVNIGLVYARGYFFANGILFAVYGTILSTNIENLAKIMIIFTLFIFASVISFSLFMLLPHYIAQLNHCSTRCAEIEEKYQGSLFKNIHAESNNKNKTNSTTGSLRYICIFIIIIWMLLFLAPIFSVIDLEPVYPT